MKKISPNKGKAALVVRKTSVSKKGNKKKLVKKVYTSSPTGKKIDHLESARCAIPPTSTVITANIFNLDSIAAAIVGHLNFAKGAVPITGTVFNAGAVSLYLNQCLYAFMARCGIISGNITTALTFSKYRVPTLVAVLFQHVAPYTDKKLGNTITMRFPNFTDSYVSGLAKSESINYMYVSDSAISGYGGESTFSQGVSVSVGSYTEGEWSQLSDWISTGFETVSVSEIGLHAPSHYGLIARTGVFRSIKPIIGNIAYFGITSASAPLGPHAAPFPIVLLDMNPVANALYDPSLWGYAMWSTSKIKYEPSMTPAIIFRKQKLNPLLFSLNFVSQSMNKLALNILDFMVQIGVMTAGSTFSTTMLGFFLYSLGASYGRALASCPYFCRPNAVNSPYIPQYSTPSYLKLKVPAYETSRGYLPTRVHDTVMCPFFHGGPRTLLNVLQPAQVVTADWNAGASLANNFGVFPFSTTVPNYTLFGQLPLAISVISNIVPLRLIEEYEAYINLLSTQFNGNFSSLMTEKEFCPCGVPHVAGANKYESTLNLSIVYPLIPTMWCARAVDTVSCRATVAASLNNLDMICNFWQPIYDVAQNPVRTASEGSHLNNNVFNFNMAGASSSGDLAKAVSSTFNKSLLGSSENVPLLTSGMDLIKSARQYLVEGGPVGPPPSPNFWNDMLSNSYNLFELISKTASGINYVAPSVVGAVQAAKVLQTYKPLLSLV